ncbi:MAG: hypothetical protein EOP88_11390, partial [Verrucomicrobiaceae bacterium]
MFFIGFQKSAGYAGGKVLLGGVTDSRLARKRLCMAKQGMTTREEAVEQLRVIRSVMERATVFRALSGETALIGGAAALAAAWASEGKQGWAWAGWWLGGLALVLGFYVFQIYR